jgi:putative ABC transport system permease protein
LSNIFRFVALPRPNVDLGIVRAEEFLARVKQDLIARLPNEVAVLTRSHHAKSIFGFVTPDGVIFAVGLLWDSSGIICYQVLANDIADHLSEFATPKAMGYTSGFFQIVIRQSLTSRCLALSVLG